MTFWLTVAGMLGVTFGSRFAGLALHRELPDFWVRFLHFVPIAVFAALVAWRTANLGLAIAVGMLAFWLLRIPF